MKKEFHVISHTHWDREWYQPYEEFRLRLVDLVDHLLEIYESEPDYVFHLDAQTICLEDYLEIRPQHSERLKELIRTKRLLVGPWYVHNDFYLTSGEATIRNLLIGSQIAESYGHCSMTGYTPDQFGLIGQLPQIFKNFGIENCLFGRGYNLFKINKQGERVPVPTPNEFEWQSPDGSSVLTVLMRNWYNNAQRFSEESTKSERFLKLIDEALEPTSTTPFRLLMNGVDHLEAQENLLPILDKLNASLRSDQVFQSTMFDYLGKVRAYLKGKQVHSVRGELREGINEQILQGTLSSRPYLKTANAQAQALLELKLEPLWSMLGLLTKDATRYPQDELRHLWKMLLKNHPHDSICGCSRDEVHRDNEHRFKRVFEMSDDLLRRGLLQLASRIERSGFGRAPYFTLVTNTLPFERSETVTARVYLPCEDGVTHFLLKDEKGHVIDFDVLESRIRSRTTITPINLPGQIPCRELLIRFYAAKIPSCGYKVYSIEPCKAELKRPKPPSTPKKLTLENEFLKVSVSASGRVTLLDKKSGLRTTNLLSLTDEADFGHSYNFIAAQDDKPIQVSAEVPKVTLLERTRLCQSVELKWEPLLPAKYDRTRGQRSKRHIRNTVALKVSLHEGSRQLQIAATVNNRSKDHRLRLLVNTNTKSDFSQAAAPFEMVKRDRRDLLKGINEDGTQPNSGMVWVGDKERAMAVLNEGIYEYEHLLNKQGSLAFTLVRSTGEIINGGYVEPEFDAETAPEWSCSENQCIRELSFRLAVVPGVRNLAELERMRLAFMSRPLTVFEATDSHKFSGGRVCVQDSDVKELFYRDLPANEICLPKRNSALELKGSLVFSALKRSEDGKAYLLRSWNPGTRSATFKLKVSEGKELAFTNMAETKGTIGPTVAPQQIGKAQVVSVLIQ